MVQLFRCRFLAVSAVILLALVVLSDFSPQAGGQEPQGNLILDPQLVNIMQGYGFNINVTLQNVTILAYFNTHLTFNTSRISLQTYAYRDGWSGGCGSESGGLVCSGEPSSGSFTGSAVVITITFRCENAGSSQIAVSTSEWAEYPYGSVWHDFAVTQGATVNQAAPVTVTSTVTETTTTTTSRVSTTISQTTVIVTSWGYVTRSGTTTMTSLVTSVVTSEVTSTLTNGITSVLTSVVTTVSTTGGSTVTSTLTSMGTTTIRTTETTTSVQSFMPPSLPSRCVIATAAYGSELAPDVAYMRYVRDDLIGSSILGRTLVVVFNEFYYSWSPAVAEWIAGSTLLMAVFRLLLLPLVGIVHVTALVFAATAHATGQTDAASLFGFLAAAIMTITVYVLLPIIVAAKSTRAIGRLRTRFRSQSRHLHVG
jgi:hypothetical protein